DILYDKSVKALGRRYREMTGVEYGQPLYINNDYGECADDDEEDDFFSHFIYRDEIYSYLKEVAEEDNKKIEEKEGK
ncbi:MAG: hypothetical protein ACRCX2_36645, partial [Paraclostridium sp.]